MRRLRGVVLCAALTFACSSGASSRRPELRTIALPDLAKMEKSVQEQMRERYASVTQRVQDQRTAGPDLAAAFGELGELLTAAEYFDAAEPCFLNAAALAPSDARWPYYLGHLFRYRDDLSQSAHWFQTALGLQPRDVATLVWLGNVYLDQNRAADAERRFTDALSIRPDTAAAAYGLGRSALARGDHVRAVEHLKRALTLYPGGSVVHYPLAMAYRGLNQKENAERELQLRGKVDVLPPDPLMARVGDLLNSSTTYDIRGDRALEQQDWSGAAEHFRKGLALAPANAALHLKLGTALFMTGDPAAARMEFEEAIQRSPSFAKAHYSLGVLLASSGRIDEATEQFAAAVRSDGNDLDAQLALADALRRTGRERDALLHYDSVPATDARAAQARFGAAMALVRLHRYAEARDVLVETINAHTDRPELRLSLARLLAAAPDDSVRDGRQALTIVTELLRSQRGFDVGEAMAMALAETGRYDEAIAWQREAMDAARQAGREDFVRNMRANLTLFQSRRASRTAWNDADPVSLPAVQSDAGHPR